MKPINWPTPPYYDIAEDLNSFKSEPCSVVFNEGHELHGELTQFAPEGSVLEIVTATGDISKPKLPFVNHLRLVHPVHLKKKAGLIKENQAAAFKPSEKQTCSVSFTNGKKLEGETIGFVMDKSGLYLFLVEASGAVIRHFIPAQAIQNYQIGEEIGKMLVKAKVVTQKEIESGLKEQEQLRSKRIGE
jgi:hypothetical protein